MSHPIISVENLGKKYLIRHQRQREPDRALRDVLARKATIPVRWLRQKLEKNRLQTVEPLESPHRNQSAFRTSDGTLPSIVEGRPAREEFWALKDVSFEIREGEVVGIIGRNGAGKSTLLRILSRITEPTMGRVRIKGHVASLLEVGTGFHPELTGRENIFLNGAILGMPRDEIRRKFDEIVAFAEVEKFLDLPVKRYSSGMYVRLAFAVAAHLEPEILVVDEVLAVGDASFQKKCLNKMETVGKSGRTVLFVSHSMPTVTRLCSRIVLLDQGRVVRDGPSHDVVRYYMRSDAESSAARCWDDPRRAPGNDVARLRSVRALTQEGQVSETFDIRRPIHLEVEFEVIGEGHALVPNLHFINEEGTCVFVAVDRDSDWRRRPRPIGRYRSTAWIPGNFLAEGSLMVTVALSTLDPVVVHVQEPEAIMFSVQDSLDGDSARGDYAGHFPGVVRPILKWSNQYLALEKESAPSVGGKHS
jgi:lipopolysaccharide transport system ATP-binding protein